MPRANYMTISAHETVQQMFDEFVARRGLTKTVALSDMLELYMLAKDEQLYLELKHKYLNSDAIKQKLSEKDKGGYIMNEFIIMRLSNDKTSRGEKYDGEKTMQIYIADQETRGYTWFSTNALYAGMAREKVKKFNNAISHGEKVTIVFTIGKLNGNAHEIAYKANVLEIRSSRQPETLPTNDYPAIWHGEEATIWLKIENLQNEDFLKTNMFKFVESGEDLQEVINVKSQFAFGYITLK